MPAPGFEWFIAWRHLRDPERQAHKTLVFGLVVVLLGALCLGATVALPKLGWFGLHKLSPGDWPDARPVILIGQLKTAGIVALIVGGLLTLLGALFATFTVFAAVSIFGVFLGTGAPIIALSVMSGFEADLKTKIRATKADVVVEKHQDRQARPFTDWEAVEKRLDDVPGVVGAMPYIEAEVIIKHATNPAGMGIILRGIDPGRAPRVLGLDRTMQEGKVEYLDHPEQIPTEEARFMRPIPAPEDEDDATGTDDPVAAGSTSPPPPRERARVFRDLPTRPPAEAGPPPPGILLGEELFQHTLRVFVGSDVDIACPMCGVGPTGPMPKLRPFRVAGHFYVGMYEFDSKLAYISLREAQRFLNMPGEVSGIEVRTRRPEDARAVADAIAARIGPGYDVRTWEELNRGLFAALKLEKLAMFIVLTFIALVASFSIISNLIMLVTEKGREVAILKSMGARDGAILRVFFAEGLYIGMVGLALGLALGIGGCVALMRYGLPLDPDVYYIQKLPVVMRASEVIAVSLAALALCCLATVYPALLGSRMRPVDGLRYE